MTIAADILERFQRRGVRLRVERGRLVAEGPVTPRLRDELRDHEAALVEILEERGRVGCPHYEPIPGTRRCRSYYPNGACSRPDELMCICWLAANGHRLPVQR